MHLMTPFGEKELFRGVRRKRMGILTCPCLSSLYLSSLSETEEEGSRERRLLMCDAWEKEEADSRQDLLRHLPGGSGGGRQNRHAGS